MLLSKVHWLQRDDTKELVPVGGDVDFFVDSIASRRPDMQHFKANRLKLFLARQLFNSGKRVELYAGRGREAAARGWRLAKDAPVDAHLRIPRVLDGSPFAFPSCAASVERDLSESLEPCGVDGPLRHAPQAAQVACGDGSAAAARDPQVMRLPALAPCTVHRAPCTVHTLHRAPCTVHRAPCTVQLTSPPPPTGSRARHVPS